VSTLPLGYIVNINHALTYLLTLSTTGDIRITSRDGTGTVVMADIARSNSANTGVLVRTDLLGGICGMTADRNFRESERRVAGGPADIFRMDDASYGSIVAAYIGANTARDPATHISASARPRRPSRLDGKPVKIARRIATAGATGPNLHGGRPVLPKTALLSVRPVASAPFNAAVFMTGRASRHKHVGNTHITTSGRSTAERPIHAEDGQ